MTPSALLDVSLKDRIEEINLKFELLKELKILLQRFKMSKMSRSTIMRLLITEAASQVAYHLVPLLASGGIIYGQSLELILCDREENYDDMTGLAMELQDCVYPALSRISTSCNFCEAFKTADMILVLPELSVTTDYGQYKVDINCSSLTQFDFQGLDGAFHPTEKSRQNNKSLKTTGPLSTAVHIADYLKEVNVQNFKQNSSITSIEYTCIDKREEAQFGMVPFESTLMSDTRSWTQNTGSLNTLQLEADGNESVIEKLYYLQSNNRVLLVFSSLKSIMDNKADVHKIDNSASRLSRL